MMIALTREIGHYLAIVLKRLSSFMLYTNNTILVFVSIYVLTRIKYQDSVQTSIIWKRLNL